MAKQATIVIQRRSMFHEIVKFIRAHRILTAVVAAALLAVAGVVSFKVASQKDLDARASFAFSQAQKLEEYKAIVRDFPGTQVYVPALFNMGDLLMGDGKFDEALRCYVEIALRHKDSYLAPRALCAMGYLYQDKRDFPTALECYQKVMKDYPQSGWGNEAAFNIARCYEGLGQMDKAEGLYTAIITQNPATEWYNDIKYRLGKIRESKAKTK
jgi:TolA-binding protein